MTLFAVRRFAPVLVTPSPMLGGLVTKLYGGVVLVNVVGSSLMLTYLSMFPGLARKVSHEGTRAWGSHGSAQIGHDRMCLSPNIV